MKTMKILQIINSLSSGGAEVFAAGLAIALKTLGGDVEIFTYCGAIDEKGKQLDANLAKAGIAHHSPKLRKNALKPAVPFFMARTISEFKPDVCHSHLEQSDFFLALAAKLAFSNAIKVRTIHNVYAPTALPAMVHRWLQSSFSANVACGPAVRAEYPYLRAADFAINNGIDLTHLAPTSEAQNIKAILGITAQEALFIHIGAFSIRDQKLQKAQDIIVKAMAKTSTQNYVVAFLGDGEQRAAIERLASDLGVIARCRFLGRVTNPADYLAVADGVLMPSRFEGLSIGCIEAVCAGRPVIASDISAFSPFTKSSTLLVAPEDVIQLADKIDKLLSDGESLQKQAHENQAEYCHEFDIKSVASRYLRCYENLLNANDNS